jgi:hypothetical protein
VKQKFLISFTFVCKNQSPPCGEPDGEVIRQLSELAKSEVAAAYVEAEPTCDLMPPWASSGYGFGHGDFGALGTEAVSEEAPSVVVPCQVYFLHFT